MCKRFTRYWMLLLLAIAGALLCIYTWHAQAAAIAGRSSTGSAPAEPLPLSKKTMGTLSEFGLADFAQYYIPRTKTSEKAYEGMPSYFGGAYDFEAGNYKGALSKFEKARAAGADDPVYLLGIARTQEMMLQQEAARQTCDKILAQDPSFVPALILKGDIYEKEGNFAAATKAYEQVLSLQPKNLKALEPLAMIYFQRFANYDKSIELFERIVSVQRRHNLALIYLGSIYALKGNIEKSIYYYDQVYRYYPMLIGKYVQLGMLLEENKQPDAALRVYRKVLGLQPNNTEAQKLLELLVSRTLGRDAILAQYRDIAQEYPDSADVQQLYATKLIAFGKYDDASKQLEKVLRLEPEDVESYVKLGAIALIQGRQEEARQFFDKASEAESGNIETFLRIGDLLRSYKQYENAIVYYQKAAEIEPTSVAARSRIAETYRDLKQYEKAEGILQKLLAEQPNNAQLNATLGDLYQEEEKNDLAIEAYKKALELAPQNLKYFSPLAYLYLSRNDLVAVEQTYKPLLDKLDDDTKANLWLILGRLYEEFGKMEKARDAFAEYVKEKPQNLAAYGALSGVENRLKHYDEALALLDRAKAALGKAADTPEFYIVRGLTLYDQRKYNDAIREFDAAVRLEPDNYDAQRATLLALKKLGKYDDVTSRMQQMRLAFPDKKEDLDEILVDTLLAEKKFSQAEDLVRPLIEAQPDSEDLHYLLANVYYEAKEYDKAEQEYRKVIEINPDNVDGYNNLGYMFAEQGVRLDEAEELIKKALKKKPMAGYILDSLAWVYYKRGEYKKAQEYFEKALSLEFEDPALFDHLGDTYKQLGDRTRARAFWKRALELEPDNPREIQTKLNQLR
jgi:tetratricopeptide (TPR) repeat protein